MQNYGTSFLSDNSEADEEWYRFTMHRPASPKTSEKASEKTGRPIGGVIGVPYSMVFFCFTIFIENTNMLLHFPIEDLGRQMKQHSRRAAGIFSSCTSKLHG